MNEPDGYESSGARHPILLYDGLCGLCNRLVQFVLRHDADALFHFASLQSPLARQVLARHGADATDLDTMYVVANYDLPDEHLLPRSDAVIFILACLGASGHSLSRAAGFLLSLIPPPLRELGYRIVARNRYRIFGRSETCILPAPEHRDRFMDS
jgi:predicted DCC family thiol-disulfide oxidoreductase YuxK